MAKTNNLRAVFHQKVTYGNFKIDRSTVYSVGQVEIINWEDDSPDTDEEISSFNAASTSDLELLVFAESEGTSVDVQSNNATSPAQTFTITPSMPLIWGKDCGFANLVTTTITSLFLTVTGTGTKFKALSAHTGLGT